MSLPSSTSPLSREHTLQVTQLQCQLDAAQDMIQKLHSELQQTRKQRDEAVEKAKHPSVEIQELQKQRDAAIAVSREIERQTTEELQRLEIHKEEVISERNEYCSQLKSLEEALRFEVRLSLFKKKIYNAKKKKKKLAVSTEEKEDICIVILETIYCLCFLFFGNRLVSPRQKLPTF